MRAADELGELRAATALITHHSDACHLQRHRWRALHQTRATVSHYSRRGDPCPACGPGDNPSRTDHNLKI
ncbi:hypothetical protein ACFWP5_49125 [Streptomyces sp. NPDC058469]|uniref:hypothetical protein n=1 Tax=Streptomyces sp. NPDC058469 TaxID=3346514 RepID=UPI0036486101